MHAKTLLILGLALLCLSPTSAAWGAKGSNEPDTRRDVSDGWMFTRPDVSPTLYPNNVYFDAFPGTSVAQLSTTFDPNLATLGSAHQPTPYQAFALLGVWKDCNNDGFIGLGDHGLWEYRSELLLDTHICPRQSVPYPVPDGWLPVHNDGAWVHEFLPIGYDPSAAVGGGVPDDNAWDVRDQGARVWGDNGLPGAPPKFACYIDPVPAGTFHQTGRALDYADCFDADRVRATEDEVGTLPTVGPTFNDADASVRATNDPWGDARDGSAVHVWDCSQPQILGPREVTRSFSVGLSSPFLIPEVDPSGSPAGTLDELTTGLDDCDRANNGDGSSETTGRSVADAPYIAESTSVKDQTNVKVQTDEAFGFYQQARGTVVPRQLGIGTPNDLGVGQTSGEGFWIGRAETLTQNTFLDRDHLAAEGSVSPVQYTTAYAFVTPSAVSQYGLGLPKGATTSGSYGAEACGGFTSGVHGGWDCDPTHWWPDNSEPTDPNAGGTSWGRGTPNSIAAFPGYPYNLRDIDCYDESATAARDQGLSWGTVSGTSCDDAN